MINQWLSIAHHLLPFPPIPVFGSEIADGWSRGVVSHMATAGTRPDAAS